MGMRRIEVGIPEGHEVAEVVVEAVDRYKAVVGEGSKGWIAANARRQGGERGRRWLRRSERVQ